MDSMSMIIKLSTGDEVYIDESDSGSLLLSLSDCSEGSFIMIDGYLKRLGENHFESKSSFIIKASHVVYVLDI